ncbi:unnamed protein product, partial [Mesorhabditis belari]|uniref:Vezatin n=1 Tax=Mesorhabditis belari TaxID=2138241 RepID=A0AAF3FH71_9BILA
MNPFVDQITRDFADRLLKSDILEESDFERVQDLLAVTDFQSIISWKSALFIGVPACGALFLPRNWSLAVSLPSLSILGVTCAHFYQNSRLIRSSRALDESFNRCLHEIQTRQSTSFGLSLSGNSLNRCRHQVTEILQSLSKDLRIRIRNLCPTQDETKHLYENFLPKEAKALLGDENEENQTFVNLNSIKTLWELCRLFRSEFSFHLFCKTRSNSWNAFKETCGIRSTFDKAASQLTRIGDNLNDWKRIEKTEQKTLLVKADGISRAKVQLQELLTAIESGELDEKSLATAILKIYHQFCSSNASLIGLIDEKAKKNLEQSLDEKSQPENSDISYMYQPREQDDQVLEATASTSNYVNSWHTEENDEYFDKASGLMILKELQEALVDRANEMQIRERKALAAFYQIDERELDEKIRQNESILKENQRRDDDDGNEGMNEETIQKIDRDLTVRRLHQLPNLSSELANAIRSSVQVKEEILETSDLSD